jgi:ATP-binding cassette subfamily C protein CydD
VASIETLDDGAAATRKPFDRRLIRELAPVRNALIASVAIGLLATTSIVVQALALARILASALPGAHHIDVGNDLAILGAAFGLRGLCACIGELIAARSATSAKADLRARLVSAGLYGATSASRTGAGDLATLAGRGLDALDVYLGRCLPDLVLAAIAPIALLAVIGGLDWLSGVVIIVVIVLFPVFGALVGRVSAQLTGDRWQQLEALGRQVADVFAGLALLKAFGRSAQQRTRIKEADEALRRASLATLRGAFLSALVLDTLASISVALVAVPLGLRLLDGGVRLSTALAVLIIAPEVFLPLRRASAEFHESTEGLAASEAAFHLIGGSKSAGFDALGSKTGRAPADPCAVPVRLNNVCIALSPGGVPVLSDACLTIWPGESVVLFGPNGAGKSTTLSALLGFVRPCAGSVTVGNDDLRYLEVSAWRRRVTYLPEHPTLLSATLAENLRLANPHASDAECIDALYAVGAADLFAKCSDGLATPIGEEGRMVSAGERQKIALARVVLRPASLFLLDEPTIHLDDASETRVIETLRRNLFGRSALIVTHRAALVSIADRVLTLRDGNFVEENSGQFVGRAPRDAFRAPGTSPDSATSPVIFGPSGVGTVSE